MDTFKSFIPKLYDLNDQDFPNIALEVFRFQARHNPVYRQYVHHLRMNPDEVDQLNQIPFLPITCFKSHTIMTQQWEPVSFFTSSGTTQQKASKHAVWDMDFYLDNATRSFHHFFGPLENYHFLALLPSYLERSGSSLIAMIDFFIRKSQSPHSGFYLSNIDTLLSDIEKLKHDARPTILWGVSFALLDLADQYEIDLSHCLFMETGGMKGRRKEITRGELHAILKQKLNADKIFSEYGMTELFSQAYTNGGHIFKTPPWMKVIGRDVTDPLSKGLVEETAGLNVIDLANFATISFIETEDMGKIFDGNGFEVLGRMDNSEARGCNLLL
ncbi:MAG TPA: acyl transferase [Ohtaekwangia sp.]|nr:acyl transferase [Ohtaekwangia sp.]